MLTVRQDELVKMQWHLALCKPNQHRIAQRSLERLGCDVFIPKHETQRRHRGRVIKEARPIFAGYIFLGMDPSQPIWRKVKSAPGVSQAIETGGRGPATVPAEVVAGLMARCDADGILQPEDESFAVGDRIRILSGPFADFVTSIEKIEPDQRLQVLLSLLGRPTRVKLDPSAVTRLSAEDPRK